MFSITFAQNSPEITILTSSSSCVTWIRLCEEAFKLPGAYLSVTHKNENRCLLDKCFVSSSETRGTDISTKQSDTYVLKQTELRVGYAAGQKVDSKGYYKVMYTMVNYHSTNYTYQ